MSIKQKEIKQAALTNNCPECFSNEGLLLTFYQKHIENAWYKNATKDISDTIVCKNCKTDIYPVRWTDDIERVREFYLKTVDSPKTFFKLTQLSIFVMIGIVVTAIAIFIFMQQQ
ncbi:hypothetical protein HX109_03855 [Galbibacter sp. BG1]|uniref:hypothetical protein n=1 Tax=Galbibacter sp. BG1 TaxID=1170699 RepID=UPI0015B9664F|nr:hypothetical protein [Galbibacter sp. BG1]QLE00737.1 hypothetical protein HX109_03855 [Galbibacter sp. BG1]